MSSKDYSVSSLTKDQKKYFSDKLNGSGHLSEVSIWRQIIEKRESLKKDKQGWIEIDHHVPFWNHERRSSGELDLLIEFRLEGHNSINVSINFLVEIRTLADHHIALFYNQPSNKDKKNKLGHRISIYEDSTRTDLDKLRNGLSDVLCEWELFSAYEVANVNTDKAAELDRGNALIYERVCKLRYASRFIQERHDTDDPTIKLYLPVVALEGKMVQVAEDATYEDIEQCLIADEYIGLNNTTRNFDPVVVCRMDKLVDTLNDLSHEIADEVYRKKSK